MSNLRLMLKFFKKNLIKNIIIIFQIAISIYVLTFIITQIVSHFETKNMISEMNLENKVVFAESLHISTLLPGEGRTQKYSDLKSYLKNLDGVEKVSSSYNTQLKNQDYYTYIYDKELCNSLYLNLQSGKQFKDVDINSDVIPIIISPSLKNDYLLNSIYEFSIYNNDFLRRNSI